MATVPTGKLERELRRLYMQWVHRLPQHQGDLPAYTDKFRRESLTLINKMGGDISRLGVAADFPAPKELDLSLHVGTIYSDMELAAIRAQISTGLNALDSARALQRAGVDKAFHRLERVARTETVSAYWKNQWDEVDGLGLVMLWGSESGPRTCDFCRERDGLVVDDPNIRDHPNGRCTLVPTHPSNVEYRGTLRPDGTVYRDKKWDKKPEMKLEPAPVRKEMTAREAVDEYRLNSFQLNDLLRNGGQATDQSKALDQLIKRSRLGEPTMVRWVLSGEAAEEALRSAHAGKAYRDRAFMSTQKTSHGTTADAVADYANMGGQTVQLMFKVGDNTPALDVAAYLGDSADAFYDEGEVLLPRNLRLLPGKPRRGADGIWYILMKTANQGGA